MNHQGLRWNVHCVAHVGLRKSLNLFKRGFKIYDRLVYNDFLLFFINNHAATDFQESAKCLFVSIFSGFFDVLWKFYSEKTTTESNCLFGRD